MSTILEAPEPDQLRRQRPSDASQPAADQQSGVQSQSCETDGLVPVDPNYAVSMMGNFGTLGGSVVSGTLNLSGNAPGTVKGSVVTMYHAVGSNSVYPNGSADIFSPATPCIQQAPSQSRLGVSIAPPSDSGRRSAAARTRNRLGADRCNAGPAEGIFHTPLRFARQRTGESR